MAKRYSRVKQGARLNFALTNYTNYWLNAANRPSRIGTQGPRGLTQTVYIRPFGIDLGGVDERIASRVQPAAFTALSPQVNDASTGAEVLSALGANELVTVNGFTPARVTWQRANTRSVSTPTSEITGLEYLKYEGVERFSCPFGRKADGDNIYDTFNAIKAKIRTVTGYAVNRVSLKEENMTYKAN